MKKIITAIAVFISLSSFAQQTKVIAVKTNKDTINGYINDKQWLENPTEVKIKSSTTENYQVYTAEDLTSFKVETGDFYLSEKVNIDATPLEFEQEYLDTTKIKFDEKRVFLLREYSSNEINIYSYLSKGRLHIFLQKGNSIPEELIYRNYTIKRSGGIFEREDKTYFTQLNTALDNCPFVQQKLPLVKYTVNDIVNISALYSKKCIHNSLKNTPDKKKNTFFEVFAIAGATKNIIGLESTSFRDVPLSVKGKYETPITPIIGGRFNIAVRKNHQRISLGIDVFYNQVKANATDYVTYTNSTFYTKKTISIENPYIKAALLGRYTFGFEKTFIRPYVQAGLGSALLISQKGTIVYDDFFNNIHHITTEDPYVATEPLKSNFGMVVGAGAKINRFIIDYKYEKFGGIVNNINLSETYNAHNLTVGFRIL